MLHYGYFAESSVGPASAGRKWACFAVFAAIAFGGNVESAQAADPLGRLFTTQQQRKQLDDLRMALPQGEEAAPVQLSADPFEADQPEDAPVNGITVRGLVTREDGKGMAWINDSNTFEGDLASQYLRIGNRDIRAGGVQISVPGRDDAVRVKVGETFNPATGEIMDLAEEDAAPSPLPSAVPPPANPD